jgi:hypothetical protein
MEMIHDARIVPMDGRPHDSPNIRKWMGDSRGHWEGNWRVQDAVLQSAIRLQSEICNLKSAIPA